MRSYMLKVPHRFRKEDRVKLKHNASARGTVVVAGAMMLVVHWDSVGGIPPRTSSVHYQDLVAA